MADSMREALSAAFDKHAAEDETSPTDTAQAAEAAPTAEPQIDSTPDPKVEAPPSEKKAGDETPPATGAAATQPAAATPVPVPAAPPAKPPRSWSAEAKAAFAALPEPVKQDVLRREKEISQGLEVAAPARKHYEAFNEVVRPFQPLFDAYGVRDPLPVVRELLTARATLEIGTPEQKAAFLANIIHDYGIDIQTLDNLLVQRGPVQPFRPAPAQRLPDFRSIPELAPLFALAERAKEAVYEKAEAGVEAAAALPHFEDLRDDIADIIEHAHQRGKTLSIEQAHKAALALNGLEAAAAVPQISKSQAAAILASRNAASSVSGAPRTGTTVAPNDRRGQLAAAWDDAR